MQYPEFAGPEHGLTFDFPVDGGPVFFFFFLTSSLQMSCGNFWSLRQIDSSIGFSLHLHSLFGNKSFPSMVYV